MGYADAGRCSPVVRAWGLFSRDLVGRTTPLSSRASHPALRPHVDDSVRAYASPTRGGADSGFADSRERAEDVVAAVGQAGQGGADGGDQAGVDLSHENAGRGPQVGPDHA